jgi:hypothetical protein
VSGFAVIGVLLVVILATRHHDSAAPADHSNDSSYRAGYNATVNDDNDFLKRNVGKLSSSEVCQDFLALAKISTDQHGVDGDLFLQGCKDGMASLGYAN